MITITSPEIIALIGFVGGIVGGIIVNFVTLKLQKREDRIIEEEKIKRDFYDQVKSLLTEIVENWDKETKTNSMSIPRLKNDFDIYSRKLTFLISSPPKDIPSDEISQLRELSVSLKNIAECPIGVGQDLIFRFTNQSKETVALTKKVLSNF